MGGKIQIKMIEDYTNLLVEGLETVRNAHKEKRFKDTLSEGINQGYIKGLEYAISLANDMKKATKEGFNK